MGTRADTEQRERRNALVPESILERTLCRGGIRIGAYSLISLHHVLRAYHIIGLYAQRKFAQRLLFHRRLKLPVRKANGCPAPTARASFHLSDSEVSICGGGEIRTHDTVSRIAVFETAAFNHSATPPKCL